jgi:hypothetical protein
MSIYELIETYAAKFIERQIREHEGFLFMQEAYKYLPDLSAPAEPYVPYYEPDDDSWTIVTDTGSIVRPCLCVNIVGVKKVCTRRHCTFAHNETEWSPETCKFNSRCKNKDRCQRLHGNETKTEALSRLGVVLLPPKKYINTKHHIQQYIMTKPFKQAQN